jgi:hypothetical protein
MYMHHLCAAASLAVVLSGCIVVRTTEHRIKLNEDGSGEGLLRLIDLRSDETTDSLVRRDFDQMLKSYDKYGIEEFERTGRKITGKQFIVHADTLTLEVSYVFQKADAVEGLHVTKDGLHMGVADSREIVKTNGKVETVKPGFQQITWDAGARKLMYIIREKTMPPGRSLADLYRRSRR